MIRQLLYKYRELLLYGIIGSFSAMLDFIIYTLLNNAGIYYLYSNTISVLFGIVTSFILNRHYNFKVKDKVIQRFTIFLSIGLSGLLLSSVILYTFIDFLHLNKIISKLISIIIVVFFQFILNKFVTFKQTRP